MVFKFSTQFKVAALHYPSQIHNTNTAKKKSKRTKCASICFKLDNNDYIASSDKNTNSVLKLRFRFTAPLHFYFSLFVLKSNSLLSPAEILFLRKSQKLKFTKEGNKPFVMALNCKELQRGTLLCPFLKQSSNNFCKLHNAHM
jgi:hypothetical protein